MVILLKALSKEQIDEVISVSREIRRRVETSMTTCERLNVELTVDSSYNTHIALAVSC